MKRKISAIFFVLVLPLGQLQADLEFSEIMYDLPTGSDQGREWVEVFNNSDKSIDITSYKFFEAGVNHKLTPLEKGSVISSQGYAVIVSNVEKFKIDHPNFTGMILDSTFSLNNTGESLALKNGDVIVNEYFYQSSFGGAGDGNSLQKINGVWQASRPTPGAENKPLTRSVAPVSKSEKKISVPREDLTQKIEPESEIPVAVSPEIFPITPQFNGQSNELRIKNSFLPVVAFLGLVLFGAVVIFHIRRKNNTTSAGEDFEILDE